MDKLSFRFNMKASWLIAATSAFLFTPASAELTPEHTRLMEQVAAATQDCVEAEFEGLDCARADALHAQAESAGICWQAERNPVYCASNPTLGSANEIAFNDAAVRQQFNQLPSATRIGLQDVMNRFGYYSSMIDGLYGPSTSRALRLTLQEIAEQHEVAIDMSVADGIQRGFDLIISQ